MNCEGLGLASEVDLKLYRHGAAAEAPISLKYDLVGADLGLKNS